MKLMVQSWNNGGSTYNAETEETAFLHYAPTHGFDNPAEVTIILSDPTGAIAQKYNVDANDVYVGPGKVVIEDPTGTDFFLGRIMRAEGNTGARTVTLYCQDWLSQLDDEQIIYEMREKLGTTDLRQSAGRSIVEGLRKVAEDDGGTYYFYDDGDYDDDGGMGFANDQHNGLNLILTNGMAGKKKWTFLPYDSTVTDADTYADDVDALWVDDNAVDIGFADNDWTLEYEFECILGHNTASAFYVDDSITEVVVEVVSRITATGSTNHSHVQIYDNNAEGYEELHHIEETDIFHRDILKVPVDVIPYVVNSDGILKVMFDVDRLGGNATLAIKYLVVHITTESTGYSTAIVIDDTINPNKIEVATDLTAAATRVWEGIPYCIAKEIYLHIESATGPILGGDTMVTLTCGDANVEDTSGISTRQYVGKTRLEVAQDLAIQDKAHFWIALGGTTVTWKSTFNDGSPETLTDTDVNSWRSTFDYSTLANKATVYGMRIGDNRLSSTYTDSTSEGVYNQTRTKITSDTGLVSEYDTLARATSLVNQYKDVQQILTATIRGNTAKASHDKTLVLGDEVSITSAYLDLSSAVYIVQRFAYDSNPRVNLTTLLLHPRVSQIGLQRDERPSFEMVMQANRRGTADRYIAAPETNEVA